MKLIHVIPIAKGISKEELSYFYRQDILPGTLVTVPLRSKERPAIVIGSSDATIEKTAIKNSSFSLKKIRSVDRENFLRPEFIRAVKKTAVYFAGTPGATLSLLLPESIFEHIEKITSTIRTDEPTKKVAEQYAFQGEDEERLSGYRSLVREEFAKKHSVLFILPTVQDILRFKGKLERGVEQYSFSLHSYKSGREIVKVWNEIVETPHPVLFFTTPKFISIPRLDIATVIIERENSSSYKMQARPFIDARRFAENYAREISAKLIRADLEPSIETLSRVKSGELMEFGPVKKRFHFGSKAEIVDMRQDNTKIKRSFATISP